VTEKSVLLEKSGRLLLNRRKFLVTSGVGVAGLTLFPFDAAYASPVLMAVTNFALAVGAVAVDINISHYVKRKNIPKDTALEVVKVNSAIGQGAEGTFSDLSQSKVYVPKREWTYFFYPVGSVDKFNALAVFFDRRRDRDSQFICSLRGPTLFGVSELARKVALKNSRQVTRRTFLPRGRVQEAGGSIDKSYNQPDIYNTDEGTVRAVYKTDGRGKGTVTVEARNGKGTLLAGGDYYLTYRMTE
jgi:predicted small secreted protein